MIGALALLGCQVLRRQRETAGLGRLREMKLYCAAGQGIRGQSLSAHFGRDCRMQGELFVVQLHLNQFLYIHHAG